MNKKIKYFFRNRKSLKRKKILGPHAKGIIYDTKNGVISMPAEDLTIGRELGFKGQWDFTEIETLLSKMTANDTIYVIGTHVGTLLVPTAKKVAQVIGYEANENTYWYMEMNLCLNKLKNVTLFQNAVGDSTREVTFYQNTVNTGGSKIKPVTDSILYNYDHPTEVKVAMIALDEHRKANQLPQPNGMIMDIEGAEYVALKGMQETLKEMRFLYVEFVPHHLTNVADVTSAQFLELIAPHFTKATFVRNNKEISLANNGKEALTYIDTLLSQNQSDDILFTK